MLVSKASEHPNAGSRGMGNIGCRGCCTAPEASGRSVTKQTSQTEGMQKGTGQPATHLPCLRQVEALDELDNGGLAAPAGPHQRHHLCSSHSGLGSPLLPDNLWEDSEWPRLLCSHTAFAP